MFLLPAESEEMHHALAMGDEPVGDEGAVAVGGIAFCAQDADAALDGRERARGGLELLGLHMIRVGRSQAAERLAFPAIGDARFAQRSGKGISGELRMAARSRIGTHVDERADAGRLQDCDELCGAARAVTDGVDQAAAALASFLSAFLEASGFLEAFLSAFLSSPASG